MGILRACSLGAAAIAGHLGLKKLVVYYDANDAQISGLFQGQILLIMLLFLMVRLECANN